MEVDQSGFFTGRDHDVPVVQQDANGATALVKPNCRFGRKVSQQVVGSNSRLVVSAYQASSNSPGSCLMARQ